MADNPNSFDARGTLNAGGRDVTIYRLDALQSAYDVARLPFSLKVLLENLLRTEGNGAVEAGDIEALAKWDHRAEPDIEIAFTPARVLLQDFTGLPAGRRPRACCSRTSPAYRRSSTWRRCATRWGASTATRGRSTRSCPPSW